MTRTTVSALAGLVLFALFAAPATAQFPSATSEQREAGARVTEVRFGSEELTIPRGETVTLTTGLYDASGNAVEGAVAVIMARGAVGPRFSNIMGQQVELTGQQPGQGTLTAVVMVPADQGSVRGTAGARQLGQISVTVLDYPAESIDIEDPDYTVYTGTSVQMSGRVMTSHGDEHATASISWRTRCDPHRSRSKMIRRRRPRRLIQFRRIRRNALGRR